MMSTADLLKKRVGVMAAALVEPGMIVGLGTGSTAKHFVDALSDRMKKEGFSITGVPTSIATR